MARAAELGERLGAGLRELAGRHPFVGDVRGKGLLWGLEFVADPATRTPYAFDLDVARRVTVAAAEEDLLIYPRRGGGGLMGDHVLVAPPLVTRDDELDELLARLDRALARSEAALASAA